MFCVFNDKSGKAANVSQIKQWTKHKWFQPSFSRQSNVLLFTLFIYSSNFVYKNNLPLFAGHICVPLLIVFDLLQINSTSRKCLSYQDVRSLLRKTFWKWCLLLTNHDGRSLQNHINHIVKDQRGPKDKKQNTRCAIFPL